MRYWTSSVYCNYWHIVGSRNSEGNADNVDMDD